MRQVSAASMALVVCAVSVVAQTGPQVSPQNDSSNAYAIVSPAPTRAQHAMVVSIHHDASDAGVQILKAGGNAVDAAVAVGFALAVVFPQAGNLGGGGFMLIRMHTGDAHFIDYREQAPAAATPTMYLDAHGDVIPNASTLGYKSIGVPGTVAGLVYAQKTYGRLTLAQDMAPATRLAREGYILSDEEAHNLAVAKNLAMFPASRHLFQRDGNFYKTGERFVQPQLARTLTRIAADPTTFYSGVMAAELAAAIQQGGGLITSADLAAYRVRDRAPLTGSYRGYDIVTAPPPSSGGVVLLEILNILSGYDLTHTGNRLAEIFGKTMKNVSASDMGPMGDRTAAQVHLIAEAFRRAYMDRDDYLADPDFVDMPIAGLTSKEYAAAWRKTIDPVKPSPSATLQRPAGFLSPPPGAPVPLLDHPDTTHFSIVDAEGNVVANTYTLNNLYGSGVAAGGLGFLLNDEMDDFTSSPGVPNQFGLVQGVANKIQPGKRPLSSMTPTIVLKDGKPLLVLGSPGGSTIITTVANDIISILDNGLNVQQAADAPRFHHQYLPDVLQVEKAFPLGVAEQLHAAGYTISHINEADEHNPGVWGDSEMIYIDPRTGVLMGADDQRHKFGKAAGY